MKAGCSDQTLTRALTRTRARLRQAALESPDLDARLLLCAAAQINQQQLLTAPDHPLSNDQFNRLENFITRRLDHEPVSRILGRREFWGLEFLITPDVLDPRPDSECLVQAGLTFLQGNLNSAQSPTQPPAQSPTVLDLGTGSGCLLLALLSELPTARGLGVDNSQAALAVARQNAASLGLQARCRFQRGNWADDLEEKFDLVLCNPPYIPTQEIRALPPEVAAHDPNTALDGGQDGLDCLRALVKSLPLVLRPGAAIIIEHGPGQSGEVQKCLQNMALPGPVAIETGRDFAGRTRYIMLKTPILT